jgi:hypothetical protein
MSLANAKRSLNTSSDFLTNPLPGNKNVIENDDRIISRIELIQTH